MKITNIRFRELTGTTTYPEDYWQERQAMPLDIYPEFKALSGPQLYRMWKFIGEGDEQWVKSIFLEIETDEGITGIAGPINWTIPCVYIEGPLKAFLIGKDPFAIERIWDQMYRASAHGRKGGYNMHAISYVDAALWDIKGKALGQPVHRLLGGPVQDRIPAYVSALGYSLEPEKAYEKVKEFRADGYTATKWFIRNGPTDGPKGERETVELVKALREAAGPDMKIMLDCWSTWDVPYTLRMARLLEEFDPYWIEEPVITERRDSYARLRRESPVRIAGGEHEFTRWGARRMMEAGTCDFYQMDTLWAGGISETMKIYTLASVYDVPLIPHGASTHINGHVSFAQNATMAPMMEYLQSVKAMTHHFLQHQYVPIDGYFYPLDVPGLGMDIDESKIESERELSWL